MAELSARRIVAVSAIAAALVGGAVAAAVAAVSSSGGSGPSSPSGGSGLLATAPVVRTTITNTVQVGGSIGYAGSYAIAARSDAGATYTWLPQAGDVIKQDEPVYSLDNEPVPLLFGAIPAYRTFQLGMSNGADIRQLTHDLIALGYGTGLTQSSSFSSATVAAVERWQRARGLSATGKISLGQVVFEPGPIRVTSVMPSVGAAVTGGTVLTATSTTPIVTVALDVSEEYLVKPGDAVTVVLPDGTSSVGGRIESVGSVASCPGEAASGSAAAAVPLASPPASRRAPGHRRRRRCRSRSRSGTYRLGRGWIRRP